MAKPDYKKQRRDAVAGSYDSAAAPGQRRKSYALANKIYRKLPTNKDPNTAPFDRDMLDASHASMVADYRKQTRSKSRSKKTTKKTKRAAPRKSRR